MPRDYYTDERREFAHQRDRYSKSSRRDSERSDVRPPTSVDHRVESRYSEYYEYVRDRERMHGSVPHERSHDRTSSREDRVYETPYEEFNQTADRKKRKGGKKSKLRDRPVDENNDHQNRSLVAAYDDISSDSDIISSDTHRHIGRRNDYDRSRVRSPSSAIREYRAIKERSHSNSPSVMMERSPDYRKPKSHKHRGVSPDTARRNDRGHGDSRRQDYERDNSPVHPPSPKKPRLKSRSPSPNYK